MLVMSQRPLNRQECALLDAARARIGLSGHTGLFVLPNAIRWAIVVLVAGMILAYVLLPLTRPETHAESTGLDSLRWKAVQARRAT
jgi:hypothetical protein